MKKCVPSKEKERKNNWFFFIRQGHSEYGLQIRGRQCGCVDLMKEDNCVDDLKISC